MSPAFLIRLRPSGPWRSGPADGAPDRVDSLYRSDRLYSAVCHALADLGLLEEWLAATAASAQPAAVFSSLFPFQGDTLFAPPPESVWPPSAASLRSPSQVFLNRVRWRAVKFVPLPVIEALLTGSQVQADQWIADAECSCLLRRDRPQSSPFRLALRSRAAVDRVTGVSFESHKLACLEFEPGAGLWGVIVFAARETAARWRGPLEAAFRLLGDTGFGGQRTAGWGQAPDPEIVAGDWPALLLPKLARTLAGNGVLSPLHWLLSLYSPAGTDEINWSEGNYRLVVRGGRVSSAAASGAVKKPVRMVSEGSVLSARKMVGRAVDVAPDGFPHPVYRSGFALALQLPVIQVTESAPPEPEPAAPSESSAILAEALASAEAEAARLRTEEQPSEPETPGALHSSAPAALGRPEPELPVEAAPAQESAPGAAPPETFPPPAPPAERALAGPSADQPLLAAPPAGGAVEPLAEEPELAETGRASADPAGTGMEAEGSPALPLSELPPGTTVALDTAAHAVALPAETDTPEPAREEAAPEPAPGSTESPAPKPEVDDHEV